jgi:hypothetical protein
MRVLWFVLGLGFHEKNYYFIYVGENSLYHKVKTYAKLLEWH